MQTFQEFCDEHEVDAKNIIKTINICIEKSKSDPNFDFSIFEEIILGEYGNNKKIDYHFCQNILLILIDDESQEFLKKRTEYALLFKNIYLVLDKFNSNKTIKNKILALTR